MIKEFKEFAMKGSLIDLAVGFVIGAAFIRLTTAFIDGIIMPFVGLIQGKDLSDWKYIMKPAQIGSDGKEIAAEVSIKYGSFISATIAFLIVAFVMFLLVKAINRLKKKQAEAPATAPEPSMTDKLLMEIRDALRK